MSGWNKLIFLHAGTNSGKLKVISMICGWAWSKNGSGHLVHQTLFNNFWLDQHCTQCLSFKCQSIAVVLVRLPVVARRIL